jgi:hypothetical protein
MRGDLAKAGLDAYDFRAATRAVQTVTDCRSEHETPAPVTWQPTINITTEDRSPEAIANAVLMAERKMGDELTMHGVGDF